jgi:hypothetical protein
VALEEAGTAAAVNFGRWLALADRVAWGLSALTDLIDVNREWIAELPGGQAFLDGVDAVNHVVQFYGMARLGFDGVRFASSKLRQAWRAPLSSAEHAEEAAAINLSVKGLQTDLDRAEQEAARTMESGAGARMGGEGAPAVPQGGPPSTAPAPPEDIARQVEAHSPAAAKREARAAASSATDAVTYVNEHPEVIHGPAGQREAPVGPDHKIVEVSDPDPKSPTGIICEFHSPGGTTVDCPHGMGERAREPSAPAGAAPEIERPLSPAVAKARGQAAAAQEAASEARRAVASKNWRRRKPSWSRRTAR